MDQEFLRLMRLHRMKQEARELYTDGGDFHVIAYPSGTGSDDVASFC